MPTTRSSDGVDISYLRLDPAPAAGSGRVGAPERVLFAHATGFCATVWRPMAERLTAGVDVECWALDFRAHGRSTPPRSGFDWAGTGDDVLAVVDAVDAEHGPATWIGAGHSMGGAALLLAEEARPGTFAGLWVFEPIVFPPMPPGTIDPGANPLSQAAARRRPAFASRAEARANYASKPPLSVFTAEALDGYLERGLEPDPEHPPDGVRLACRPADEAQVYLMGAQHGAYAGLGAVAGPVVVVRGTTDEPGPPHLAVAVAERLPRGRLEEHPELGHFGPMQDPGAMADSLAALIGGSLSGGPPTIEP